MGGPNERLGVGIVVLQVGFDCGLEFGDTMENATADGVAGDQAEEALDLIDPGGRCGREVEMEAGVVLEPSLDLGVLVRCVVVDDEMQIEQFWGVAVDGAQEAQEFLMAMAAHAFADDLARGDIERREQSRGSMALVVVGHRAGAALLQRQSGLGAIERLDLAFLVDRKHQRLVRRVEVKPDNIIS